MTMTMRKMKNLVENGVDVLDNEGKSLRKLIEETLRRQMQLVYGDSYGENGCRGKSILAVIPEWDLAVVELALDENGNICGILWVRAGYEGLANMLIRKFLGCPANIGMELVNEYNGSRVKNQITELVSKLPGIGAAFMEVQTQPYMGVTFLVLYDAYGYEIGRLTVKNGIVINAESGRLDVLEILERWLGASVVQGTAKKEAKRRAGYDADTSAVACM